MMESNSLLAYEFFYGLTTWSVNCVEAFWERVLDYDLTRRVCTLPVAGLLAYMSAWHLLRTDVMATLTDAELNAWVAGALQW